MKWFIVMLWVSTVAYAQLRGKVRHGWRKAFLDHSTLLAPINALMVLTSKIPTASRTAVCSLTTPVGYSSGIDHPPNSANFAPRAS